MGSARYGFDLSVDRCGPGEGMRAPRYCRRGARRWRWSATIIGQLMCRRPGWWTARLVIRGP